MVTIPPSIETYLLTPGISFIVPTSYKVTPASPTIERPGSIPNSGVQYQEAVLQI